MSFEARIKRLEQIVQELDGEGVELARALALFEEGIAVLREAGEELGAAEAKVRVLVEKSHGVFELNDHGG